MDDKQRTTTQNRAIHLWFSQVAEEAKSSGVTFSDFIRIRKRFDLPWSPERVKEVWKGVQELIYGTKSTTELTTKQIDVVYDTVNKGLSEVMGFSIPFPSIETLLEEE